MLHFINLLTAVSRIHYIHNDVLMASLRLFINHLYFCMKLFYLFFGSISLLPACNNPSEKTSGDKFSSDTVYSITGNIRGVNNGLALLTYISNGNVRVDSAAISNSNFGFSGKFEQPQEVQLSFVNESYNGGITFFAENSGIIIKSDTSTLNKPTIEGSSSQTVYEEYNNELSGINKSYDALNKLGHDIFESGKLNRAIADSLVSVTQKLDSNKTVKISSFVKDHPSSVVSAWAINKNLLFDPNPVILEPLYQKLSAANQTGIYGSLIHAAIQNAKATVIGRKAIEFTQPDTSGKSISLSSIKSKYLLVDFWASWCGPCRAENPNVLKAYRQYKPKGFEIIGISLDSDREAWLKAIKKDNLSWTEVSDLKAWNNPVSLAYGVKGIPFNVLLNKDGIIIAKNLRGNNLQDKLREIFPD